LGQNDNDVGVGLIVGLIDQPLVVDRRLPAHAFDSAYRMLSSQLVPFGAAAVAAVATAAALVVVLFE
jgi:hypothetical protein